MNIINSEKAPQAIGPYAQAVVTNGFLFSTGQIALDLTGQLVSDQVDLQASQVFSNLKYILEAAQADLSKVVKTTVYVTNMDDFALINNIYANAFGDHTPARSTVEVSNLPLGAKVSIDVVAVV